MLRLRDIMTREVLTLAPETSLRDAVVMLAEQRVTGAPVVVGTRVVGVLSASDIMDFQADEPATPSGRELGSDGDDEESGPIDRDDEGESGGTYFTELWWDTGAEVTERFASPESREWDQLAEHTVAEAMNRRVRSMRPDASVPAAAELMTRAGIHRVLVMDGEELRGIVTTMDITRAVADHRLESRRFVFGRASG